MPWCMHAANSAADDEAPLVGFLLPRKHHNAPQQSPLHALLLGAVSDDLGSLMCRFGILMWAERLLLLLAGSR